MEMPAFYQIILLCVIFLVPDIIAATPIIKAAVAVIIEVVVAAIVVHTIPREAVLMTDAAEAVPGGDPVHMTCHNHGHLEDTTVGHNLAKDVNLTHAARSDLDHREEDTAIIPIWRLQIANIPGVLWGLPERNDTELIKAV